MVDDEAAIAEMEASIKRLNAMLQDEDDTIAELERECADATEALDAAERTRISVEARLQQSQRDESRQHATGKLLQLQLTVATQLYGVAESLSHLPAASEDGQSWLPDAVRHREREIDELHRALKRQQLLTTDAHRQLLELTTRRKPKGAAGSTRGEIEALRTAVAEQEMGKMVAEARVDELQAQIRLMEEQGLRQRLHPPPLGDDGPPAPSPQVVNVGTLDSIDGV